MGVVENNVCNFCLTEKDTIFHFMCQCEHIQSFWVMFEMCLKEKSFNCARFSINTTLILFGHHRKTTTVRDLVQQRKSYGLPKLSG